MKNLSTKSGRDIGLVGLGTFPLQGHELADIIVNANQNGYVLFDTADDYRGETGICQALTSHCFKREDVFIQTKISNNSAYSDEPLSGMFFTPYSSFMKKHTVNEIVVEKIYNSLDKMKTDYLDSVLIHYPYPEYYERIWETLIQLKEEGLIRHLGVSNFHQRHMESLSKLGEMPEINEIYISPLSTKNDIVRYCHDNEIMVHVYSPLMDLAHNWICLDEIKKIALKYQKTISQVVLRWNINRSCFPLAKTKNLNRLKENIDISDFSLSDEEVDLISSLNINKQILVESKICPGI